MRSSELELITLITRSLKTKSSAVKTWIGDDAAVVDREGTAVTSTDAFVDGVHFERAWAPLEAIGQKALAASLSDLAAMGAEANEAYICLGLPENSGKQDLLELYAGINSVAESERVTICGGDLTRAPGLFISVTVIGSVESERHAVKRTGAKAGDLIGVTGSLGGAGAGLALLKGMSTQLKGNTEAQLIERQLSPLPRLKAGRALAAGGASAMIDLSDGLATDALHIADASQARLAIKLHKLPLQAGVSEVAKALGQEPSEFAARAGEDYELLATVPVDRKDKVEKMLGLAGTPIAWVGTVESNDGTELRLLDREANAVELSGFDHFA